MTTYRDPKTGILYPSKEYYLAKTKVGAGATTESIKEAMTGVVPPVIPKTSPITSEEKEALEINEKLAEAIKERSPSD